MTKAALSDGSGLCVSGVVNNSNIFIGKSRLCLLTEKDEVSIIRMAGKKMPALVLCSKFNQGRRRKGSAQNH